MRLTTKGRFAVTAMIDLAIHAQGRAVKLHTVSQRQGISLSYLEQLFAKLRRAGLVESIRGPGGGYVLALPPEQINVAQIIAAAEDNLDATLCGGRADCQSGTPCLTHHLWENLNRTIHDYLSGVTLSSLLAAQQKPSGSLPVRLTHIH